MYNARVTQHTVFGDLHTRAHAVYRVHTQKSVYLIGFHEVEDGRKFVVIRGQLGTDREHVVIRDSNPRIGGRSMFEVPLSDWPGKELEVATMTSSTIVSAAIETDPAAIAAVGVDGEIDGARNPWARPGVNVVPPDGNFAAPRPPGMPLAPRIMPAPARGTHPASPALVAHAKPVAVLDPPPPSPQQAKAPAAPAKVPPTPARASEPDHPYPERHVLYAENIAALLRSILRRDRLFDDVRGDQRKRLRRALDESVELLEQIRRRDRK